MKHLGVIIAIGLGTFFTPLYGQTNIIATGDEWYYYDAENAPEIGWENELQLTENWKKGISPLGYGDEGIKTIIGFGDDPKKKHITKYFKKTIRIDNPFEYLAYTLKVQRDDGIILYLNGREIMRNNMPDGIIDHHTTATGLINNNYEGSLLNHVIFPEDLNIGINIFSASVHQARATSSDCLFNLELVGENDSGLVPLLLKEQTIKSLNLNLRLKELNHKHEIENKDVQIKLIEQSKATLKSLLYTIGFLLLVTLSGLLYLWITSTKSKRKNEQAITELKNLNDLKNNEMMGHSINSYHNQQYLNGLKGRLEKVSKKDTLTLKKELGKIIHDIEFNIVHEEGWENLKMHFNAIHSGFHDQLKNQYPVLSELELKHCIFIKLRMNTKEIANILHVDPRSVQAARYRIKKKLGLDENTDLKEFLLKL
ncbi:MAG: helix-turn-helix transcriptional regulator [Flavobacteriaceae bacterium]